MGALGVLMVLITSTVPACSSGGEAPQENAALNPMENADVKPIETAQDVPAPPPVPVYEDPPPIDAAAPKVTQTATFASG